MPRWSDPTLLELDLHILLVGDMRRLWGWRGGGPRGGRSPRGRRHGPVWPSFPGKGVGAIATDWWATCRSCGADVVSDDNTTVALGGGGAARGCDAGQRCRCSLGARCRGRRSRIRI